MQTSTFLTSAFIEKLIIVQLWLLGCWFSPDLWADICYVEKWKSFITTVIRAVIDVEHGEP